MSEMPESVSSRVYRTLLPLYGRTRIDAHGDEMLQNFRDLEADTPSTFALWSRVGKDLVIHLTPEPLRTRGSPYLYFIVVGIIWAALLTVFKVTRAERFTEILRFGEGFLVGMFAMCLKWWIYTRRKAPTDDHVRDPRLR